ncbi:MAG: hypothetical protein UY22_C0036G0004 [Candidatus Amesbacteria bacterium GW2011_GWC1_48_10]|uniref:Uncharacterized protein n=1 Tax=Candidatus Amesbacteria bacterium GW2011_GWC1_48_10 TaxID=1618365 RepID=A0A0G1UDW6_9BACT|nr:MAG: hypothetical protein UY22_C0036G0004 [Candidatus Amesbacteria bacterium GW2011_GWC1_48_10]
MSEKERRDILSGTGEDLKYAKSLGFVGAHIDPKTGRVVIPRMQMLQVQEEVVAKKQKELVMKNGGDMRLRLMHYQGLS